VGTNPSQEFDASLQGCHEASEQLTPGALRVRGHLHLCGESLFLAREFRLVANATLFEMSLEQF
jgi:hypothetical protein